MESVSRITFSITGRPRVQPFARGHIKQCDPKANDSGKKKNYVSHKCLRFRRSPPLDQEQRWFEKVAVLLCNGLDAGGRKISTFRRWVRRKRGRWGSTFRDAA